MTLDELVKDVDVQEVREKNLTDEKIVSMFSDTEKVKNIINKIFCFIGFIFIAVVSISFAANLLFPDAAWLWEFKK